MKSTYIKNYRLFVGYFLSISNNETSMKNVHIAAPGTIQVSFSAQFKPKESFEF